MKVLNRFLDKVGVDKALHFSTGAMIESWFCFAGDLQLVFFGLLFILLLGVVKECLLDREGKPDPLDVAAGVLGGLLEIGCWLVFVWLKI